MTSKTDDNVLLKRIRESDSEAFDELMLKYNRMLYNIAYGILRDRKHAEDAVNAAYESLVQKCHSIYNEKSLKNWLCITVKRNALNISDKNMFSILPGDDVVTELIDNNAASDTDRIEKIHIHDCLKKLPNEQYEALMLKYQGFTVLEISKLMSISVMKIRRILRDAENNFKKFYEN